MISLSAALPIAAGVAINFATDGKHSLLAWVAVGLVVIVSVLAATWLDRRQNSSNPRIVRADAAKSKAGSDLFDLRGAQGVQLGDYNVQTNRFTSSPSRDGDDE
jgi:hypothetical protein